MVKQVAAQAHYLMILCWVVQALAQLIAQPYLIQIVTSQVKQPYVRQEQGSLKLLELVPKAVPLCLIHQLAQVDTHITKPMLKKVRLLLIYQDILVMVATLVLLGQ